MTIMEFDVNPFKPKTKMNFSLSLSAADIEKFLANSDEVHKLLEGKPTKKIIVVHNKIINLVV